MQLILNNDLVEVTTKIYIVFIKPDLFSKTNFLVVNLEDKQIYSALQNCHNSTILKASNVVKMVFSEPDTVEVYLSAFA